MSAKSTKVLSRSIDSANGHEFPLVAELRHGSFGMMHPTSRSLILKLWSARPEEIRSVPVTEDALNTFEKEFGAIPEDFRWFLAHVAVESSEANGSMASNSLRNRIESIFETGRPTTGGKPVSSSSGGMAPGNPSASTEQLARLLRSPKGAMGRLTGFRRRLKLSY